jgi:hypothetical protein
VLIVASKPGRLGNRLRVGAMVQAFSLEHGVRVANLALDEYAEHFEGPGQDLLCRSPPRSSPFAGSSALRRALYSTAAALARLLARLDPKGRLIPVLRLEWHELCDMHDPQFVNLVRQKRLLILQGWHYVDDHAIQAHADSVRAYFAPRRHYLASANRVIAAARAKADVVVGLHIRRGDYRWVHGGQFLYSHADYSAAIQTVTGLLGRNAAFVVCAEEPFDLSAASDLPVYSGTGHFVEDLYTLAACDYVIGPPSTYTAWASFYGDTPVYYGSPRAPFTLDDFQVVKTLWPPATDAHLEHELRGASITRWVPPPSAKSGDRTPTERDGRER